MTKAGIGPVEFKDYVAVLRKHWLFITSLTLLTVMAAVVTTWLTTPTYEARSQVYVSVRTGGSTSDLLQGSTFTQNQVASYRELVTSPRVLAPVIEHLGLSTTPDELAEHIRADAPLNSVLINIRAVHEDPQTASDLANATAGSLADEVTELEQPDDGPSPVQISTVRTASPPQDPASPNVIRNIVLGLVLGLALGFGLAMLRELLDTRVRTQLDVREVTDASVIATITYDQQAGTSPLISEGNAHSHRAEAFRRLRTNLQFLDVNEHLSTMVVTSALPGEGKSTTSINLATTLADAGSRVVLVDADLRRPSIAKYMGLEGAVGLTTVLIGRATVADVVQPWGPGTLDVLPSGQIPPNPSELLGSRAMADLLTQLSSAYDIVLIDTPPLLPVTDAAVLARLTQGALVVVGARTVTRQQLGDALGALSTVGARVLGLVLNRVPLKVAGSYTYYEYAPLEQPAGSRRGLGSRSKRRARSRDGGAGPRRAATHRLPVSDSDSDSEGPVTSTFGDTATTPAATRRADHPMRSTER